MKLRVVLPLLTLVLAAPVCVEAHDLASQGGGVPQWFAPAKAAAAPTSAATSARAQRIAASFAPFKPKVRTTWDASYFYEESDGLPDRTLMPNLMVGITAWNQQIPLPAAFFAGNSSNTWRIPLSPVPASAPMAITSETFLRGAIALGADGIPIFNPSNNTGRYSYDLGELDAYGGHSGMADDYHYHIAPAHLTPVLGNAIPIAWVLDGYPMYGYVEPDGGPLQTLDACGGHDHGDLGYHYHARGSLSNNKWTPSAPYMNSKFYGTVSYVERQVDPQPAVVPLRAEGANGAGYQAQPLVVKITRFLNPVALKLEGGHFVQDNASTAVPSADAYVMTYTQGTDIYDLCWKLDRSAKTLTTTWRLPAGAKTSAGGTTAQKTTTTTTYTSGNNDRRISSYAMSGPSMLKLPDTGETAGFSDVQGEDADYTFNAQAFTAQGNGTVSDLVTGLMWQSVDNGESTWTAALANAGTVRTGGYSDWRLPTPGELFSLFNFGKNNPALDTQFFPDNPKGAAQYWWTSDVYGSGNNVWSGNAGGGLGPKPVGETLSAGGNERFHARYVRNAKPTNGHNYFNNGDGTVTDLDTGLMWLQAPSSALNWKGAIAWAEGLVQAGYSDWRLPNIKELQTLIDYTLTSANDASGAVACVNRVLFPEVTATAHWASTTLQADQTRAWLAEFGINNKVVSSNGPPRGYQGILSYEAKTSAYPALAVRTTVLSKQLVVKQAGTSLVDGASSVNFGDVVYGATVEKSFTIVNGGTSKLVVSGITLDGADSSSFALSGVLSGALAAGGSLNFGVQCNAATLGSKAAALHIASSDASSGASFDVGLAAVVTTAAPSVNRATVLLPGTGDVGGPWVLVSGSAAAGATIASATVKYLDGGTVTSTVFEETMASTASSPWTGSGTTKAWTINVSGPQNTFAQAIPGSSLGFTGGALVFEKGSTLAADSMVTTTENIQAAGVSGAVEFKVATEELISTNGWFFQVSSDGGASWQTRLSETGKNHVAQSYRYALVASELVNTLKLRFQFAGYDAKYPARAPKIYLDDIRVKVTAANPARSFVLYNDGAHKDGGAADKIYGGQVAGGTMGTSASYVVTLTDSGGKTTSATATVAKASTTLGSAALNASALGGAYPLQVFSTQTWTASGVPAWVNLGSSTGSTGTLTVTVSPNTSGAARTAVLTIGGQPFTLNQPAQTIAASVGLSLTLTPPSIATAKTYSATQLPSGLTFNAATGVIAGRPSQAGTYAFSVTPKSSAGVAGTSVSYTVEVAPLPAGLIGSFAGLVAPNVSLNRNLAGALQLTTTAAGLCSGKLTVGGTVVSINTTLDVGSLNSKVASIAVPATALGAAVKLNVLLDATTQRMSGKLTDGSHDAAVSGVRSPWSASNSCASYAGRYSVRFKQTDSNPALPQGFGFGVLTVAAPGGVTTADVTLADGTKITATTQLGLGGETVLHAPLSSGKGVLAGTLNFTAQEKIPSLNSVLGSVQWTKPATADTVYAAGFGPLNLDVAGSYYSNLAAGQRVLGLPAGSANARLSFSKGGLDTESREFSRNVTISNPSLKGFTNMVTVESGTNTVTLSNFNDATSGVFAGSLTLSGSSSTTARKVAFQGQIVTVGSLSKGYGFFLLPKLPVGNQTLGTSPKLSGEVVLEASDPSLR